MQLYSDLTSSLRKLLNSSTDSFWRAGWIYARVQHHVTFIYNGMATFSVLSINFHDLTSLAMDIYSLVMLTIFICCRPGCPRHTFACEKPSKLQNFKYQAYCCYCIRRCSVCSQRIQFVSFQYKVFTISSLFGFIYTPSIPVKVSHCLLAQYLRNVVE